MARFKSNLKPLLGPNAVYSPQPVTDYLSSVSS